LSVRVPAVSTAASLPCLASTPFPSPSTPSAPHCTPCCGCPVVWGRLPRGLLAGGPRGGGGGQRSCARAVACWERCSRARRARQRTHLPAKLEAPSNLHTIVTFRAALIAPKQAVNTMKISVIGSGAVGTTLGARLLAIKTNQARLPDGLVLRVLDRGGWRRSAQIALHAARSVHPTSPLPPPMQVLYGTRDPHADKVSPPGQQPSAPAGCMNCTRRQAAATNQPAPPPPPLGARALCR